MNDARPGLVELVAHRLSRRELLPALSLPLIACAARPSVPSVPGGAPVLGFTSVPTDHSDALVLPPGYRWQVVNAWGDPVERGAPAFAADASQTAAQQAIQAGMGHDGMEFFPLPRGAEAATRGLLAINFEYTDDGLLHPGGMEPWTAEKVRKSQAAHGIGVIEIVFGAGTWRQVPDSPYARRITASTPIAVAGPAAGHPWLRTEADPGGRTVRGTFNDCAGGRTPWGTYLACEENFAPYFVNDSGAIPPLQDRMGIPASAASWGFRWHEHDPRFDAARHPNEPNRFGWVVELDPYAPEKPAVKRTALGRMAHEGATVVLARDGRVVVYMGDDDHRSKFEHLYKFVSRDRYRPGSSPEGLLDHGTLHAARFEADGGGQWLELTHGQNGLDATAGFAGPAEILVDARTAADHAGATYLDRPEWVAVHPWRAEAYCSLTNNTARGTGKPLGRKEPLGADGPNPRAPNPMGHILRWSEEGSDAGARRFRWDVFVQAGDPGLPDPGKRGNARGGVAFACPDGLRFDSRGVLWIATDSSAQNMASADWTGLGNNQLLAADPATGELRRFLTAPVGAEVTGLVFAPDLRTLFVNIQHPGEPPRPHPARNDPARPQAVSSWPDGPGGGRPRSATIAIRRSDGGVIGT